MNNHKIDFSKLSEAQERTKPYAAAQKTPWSPEEREFVKKHMFSASIEEIARAISRTAYAVETMFTKDPEFLELRRKAGDVPNQKTRNTPVNEKQYFVSSDTDVLFGTGD